MKVSPLFQLILFSNILNIFKDGIFVVKAPPGAGKTFTIIRVIEQNKEKLGVEYKIAAVIYCNVFEWQHFKGIDNSKKIKFESLLLDYAKAAIEDVKLRDKMKTISDIACHFYKRNKRKVLFILDDCFNPAIINSLRTFSDSVLIMAVTKYPLEVQHMQMSPPMTNPYEMPHLSDEQVQHILEGQFNLRGNLDEKQMQQLVNICFGLPLAVDLVGGNFRAANCQSPENFQNIFNDIIPLSNLEINNDRGERTVAELFQHSFAKLEKPREKHHFFALLFLPATKRISPELLSHIWNTNEHETKQLLKKFQDYSLIRCTKMENGQFYISIHQIIHELAAKVMLGKDPNMITATELDSELYKSYGITNRGNTFKEWFRLNNHNHDLLRSIFSELGENNLQCLRNEVMTEDDIDLLQVACEFNLPNLVTPIASANRENLDKLFENTNKEWENIEKLPSIHIAFRKNHREILKILLKFGADINCQDSNGDTILTLAKQAENKQDIVQFLEENGAQ